MTRDPFPPWASDFARSALDGSAITPRLFATATRHAWHSLATDDERRVVLDGLALVCTFEDLPRDSTRPADAHKHFRKISGTLRKAAHELALAREHARIVAGFAGVTIDKLRGAAAAIEAEARRRPFRSPVATRTDFVASLSAHVKAHTGRYYDPVVAALAGAVFDTALTAGAVKKARGRGQKLLKIAPVLYPRP